MKIDELIKELEAVKEQHGNLDVSIKIADSENEGDVFSVATEVSKFSFNYGINESDDNVIIKGPDYVY